MILRFLSSPFLTCSPIKELYLGEEQDKFLDALPKAKPQNSAPTRVERLSKPNLFH